MTAFTIRIPDDLYKAVGIHAVFERRAKRAIVDEALRDYIASRPLDATLSDDDDDDN